MEESYNEQLDESYNEQLDESYSEYLDESYSDHLDEPYSDYFDESNNDYFDKFYEIDEIKHARRELNQKNQALKEEMESNNKQLRKTYVLENELKGVIPAYVVTEDLIHIIPFALRSGQPISNAYDFCEALYNRTNWAKRAVRRNINKFYMMSALNDIESRGSEELALMKKYKVYDLDIIMSSSTYRSSILKLRSLYNIAKLLSDKDKEIAQKDDVIKCKDGEIDILNKQITIPSAPARKANKIRQAIELKKRYPQMELNDIAKAIGVKSYQTVSKYLKTEK